MGGMRDAGSRADRGTFISGVALESWWEGIWMIKAQISGITGMYHKMYILKGT